MEKLSHRLTKVRTDRGLSVLVLGTGRAKTALPELSQMEKDP